SVTQYIDTLKLTDYNTGNNSTKSSAFSNVVLSSFSLNTNPSNAGQAATYTVTQSYDQNIFDITQNIALTVPSVTTRAQIQNPSNLFQASSGSTGSGGQ